MGIDNFDKSGNFSTGLGLFSPVKVLHPFQFQENSRLNVLLRRNLLENDARKIDKPGNFMFEISEKSGENQEI